MFNTMLTHYRLTHVERPKDSFWQHVLITSIFFGIVALIILGTAWAKSFHPAVLGTLLVANATACFFMGRNALLRERRAIIHQAVARTELFPAMRQCHQDLRVDLDDMRKASPHFTPEEREEWNALLDENSALSEMTGVYFESEDYKKIHIWHLDDGERNQLIDQLYAKVMVCRGLIQQHRAKRIAFSKKFTIKVVRSAQ